MTPITISDAAAILKLTHRKVFQMVRQMKVGFGSGFNGRGFKEAPKTERPCLKCSTPHVNNNAFCSSACCKSYQSKTSN
jgi:hypothetical protein